LATLMTISCEPCGRRLEPHWSHGRLAHRCRHGRTSSRHHWQRPVENVYAREDQAAVFLARCCVVKAVLVVLLDKLCGGGRRRFH
jgi:site-specific DNA recombinase